MSKKFVNVILGIFIGYIAIALLNRLFEGLLASVFINSKITFDFTSAFLNINFNLNDSHSIYLYAFLFVSPLLLNVLLIEISGFLLGKGSKPDKRTVILIFQLINIGYIIFDLFFGIVSVLTAGSFPSEWIGLLTFGNFSFAGQLLFMLFLLFLFFTYLNTQIGRIRKSIPVIQKSKFHKK